MGKLIDADELYEDLANNLSSIMGDGTDGEAIDTYVTIGDIIHDTFNAQPTAYDVDAVVKKLEEFRDEMAQFGCSGILTDIIEVVKNGEDNFQNIQTKSKKKQKKEKVIENGKSPFAWNDTINSLIEERLL